jgi:hypothetical protein
MAMEWRQVLVWMRRWRKYLRWERRIALMWQGLQHLPTPTPASAVSMKRITVVSNICVFVPQIDFKTFSMMEFSTSLIITFNI